MSRLIDGTKIKDKRISRGYTLEDIQRLTGLQKTNLSEIENNGARGENPTIKTLSRLAEALNLVFVIDGNERVKIMDAFSDIQLQTSKADDDLKEFVMDADNIKWLRFIKVLKEDPKGLNSYAVKALYDTIREIKNI